MIISFRAKHELIPTPSLKLEKGALADGITSLSKL